MGQVVTVTLKADTSQAVENVEELNKELQETQKETTKANENFDELGGIADKVTGGAVSGFKGLITTLGGVTKSFKTLRGALISTGIGALIVAVGSLAAAFTASEEGQDRFSRIMRQIGVIVGNVKDVIAEFGEGLFALGGAMKKVFSGDIKGAINDVSNAFDGFSEKIQNFGEETRKELGVADEISQRLEKANRLERELIEARAQADQDRARLLEQAVDREQFTAEERIGFLQEASRIEQDITNREINLAQLRLEAKQLENSLSKSTREDLLEESQLKAEVTALETARLSKQREITSQIQGLYNEEMTARKERDAEANQFALDLQKQQEERDKIQKENQVKKDQEEKERKDRIMQEDLQRRADEARKQIEIAEFVAQAEAQIRMANVNNASAAFGLLAQLAGNNKALQAAALIGESAAGIANTIIQTQTSNAATIAQGAALAIPTAGASVAAAAKLVAANKISAGIAIASNIAATSKGLSALKGGGSAPTSPSIPGGRGANVSELETESQPPQFNIVGQGATNQLADTIATQQQKPLKAFVVASDVSTAQSLERNIVESASI